MNIEREIVIEAPPDVVWAVLTEPAQLSRWLADTVQLDARPGGAGLMVFDERAIGEPATVPLRVVEVRRPELFSFRWVYPEREEPRPGNSVLVEFTLRAEGADGTRLRVAETGLDELDWPAEQKARYVEGHTTGWIGYLGRLQAHLARERSARA